jgi:hypothetical protein
MDGRAEGARDLVLAIFRLAVCDYLGLSYGHDRPDRPRACRTRQYVTEAGLFLTGVWAAHLAEFAGFRSVVVWREARSARGAMTDAPPPRTSWSKAA